MEDFELEEDVLVPFLRSLQNDDTVTIPRSGTLPPNHGNLAAFLDRRGELVVAHGSELSAIRVRPRELLSTVELSCPALHVVAVPGQPEVVLVAHATAGGSALRLYSAAKRTAGSLQEFLRIKTQGGRGTAARLESGRAACREKE